MVFFLSVLQNINAGMQRLDVRRNNVPDRELGRPVSMATAPVRFLLQVVICMVIGWLL